MKRNRKAKSVALRPTEPAQSRQILSPDEALRRSEERLNMVLRAVQLGLFYCDLPFDKLFWNEQCKAHFWLPPDAEITIGLFYERLHPDDREPTRQAIERSIAQSKPYDINYRTVSTTGQIRWIRAIGHPYYSKDGVPLRLDGITIDISEQKQAAENLRQERDFNAAVTDTVGALVVVLDRQGRIVRFNRACQETTRYTFEEVRGRLLWDMLLVAEELQAVRAVFAQLNAGEFPNSFENYWLTKDGQRRLIAWTNTAILDTAGEPQFIIGTGIDITERRRAEAEIGRQQDVIRELSTPVLPVKEHLLIVPMIGAVDSQRARQLTEQLLRKVRSQRAKVVVIDITGVATIDSNAANHLIQTTEACQLLGARVILTGISRQIAQTLVTLGVRLGALTTKGDLRSGIEEAQQILSSEVDRGQQTRA